MGQRPELTVRLLLNIQRGWGDTTRSEHLVSAFAQAFWGKAWPGQRRPQVYAIQLEIRFISSSPALLIWEADGSSSRSTLVHPFPGTDLPLIQRVLEACQMVRRREAMFSEHDILRLRELQLWDGERLPDDVDRRIGTQLYKALIADAEAKSALDAVLLQESLLPIW